MIGLEVKLMLWNIKCNRPLHDGFAILATLELALIFRYIFVKIEV